MRGTASLRSSSRFAWSSGTKSVNPVMLPPGRARLATRPAPTASPTPRRDYGDCRGSSLGGEGRGCASMRHDDVNPECNQLGHQGGETVILPLRPSVFDGNVLPLHVAQIAPTRPQRFHRFRVSGMRLRAQKPDLVYLAGLRLSSDRRKCETGSENDREPDQPQRHLGWDGWRESSRPELLAAWGVRRFPRRPLHGAPRQGPFGGQTPRGSGSNGPVRLAAARHCKTSWLLPLESQNVIRPSRSTRSSTTGNDALHFPHRA